MNRTSFVRRACVASLLCAAVMGSSTVGAYRYHHVEPAGEHETLRANPFASSGSCGVERWSVKVGTDPDASLVNLGSPTTQTIANLRSIPAPSPIPLNARVQPTETTYSVIDATLIEYKLENDSDYHLVIKDAAGNTMIAEIADPACVSSGPFKTGITNSRAQFDAKYSASSSFQTANIPVRITGVPFFDFLHGQTGVAPNGIEIHPILNIVFNPGSGTPDFGLSASPSAFGVTQGASATTTVTVTPQNGFNSSVTFAVAGLPAGVTGSFSPASSTGSTTLTLTASPTATTGTSTISVGGSTGSLTHTTNLTLTVNPAGSGGGTTAVYNSSLKAPWCGTVGTSCDSGPTLLLGRGTMSGGVEANQPNTINSSCVDGNSGTFHSDESNDRIVVASTDGGPLTAGKVAKITATVWSYDGTSDSLDLYSAPNANSPTWTFLNTIKPSAAGAQTLTTTFALPTGGLQAVRAHFRYQGAASSCSTGAYDESDDLIFAVSSTAPAPDFSLSASPSALSANPGANASSTVTVAPLNGFSAATSLSVSGLPSGITGTIAPTPVTPIGGSSASATLTVNVSPSMSAGTYNMTLTGTSGTLTHSTPGTITVTVSSTTPTANFSSSVSGLTATFTDSSTDVGGSITGHSWTFGDGATSTATNPSHMYAAAGPYSVTETVTDSGGKTASHTSSVTVTGGSNLIVNFTVATNGLTATFTDTSSDSGATITTHSWSFGDGSTSTTTSPTHTYAAAGTYNVTETVTDSASKTSSKTTAVTLSSGPLQLIGNPGFETGTASPWTMSSGVECTSSCSGEVAHGGSWFVWLNGYGSAHTDTLSQQVTIPSGKSSATLQFYMHIDTAETGTTAYDTLKVQVYSTSGALLGTLYTYSNVNANTGYSVHNLTMTPYIGQTVVVKFTGIEDASNQTSFVIDDVNLNVQ